MLPDSSSWGVKDPRGSSVTIGGAGDAQCLKDCQLINWHCPKKVAQSTREGISSVSISCMKLIAYAPVVALCLCTLGTGCATTQRWQTHDVIITWGAAAEHTNHEMLLLDTQTGSTWILG